MKKNILMFTCSALTLISVCKSVCALTPNEQLKAVKEVFVKSFEEMDTDADGKISKKEYLKHQFEKFRMNIMEADSFDASLSDKLLEGIDTKDLQDNDEKPSVKASKKDKSTQKEASPKGKKQEKNKEETKQGIDSIKNSTDIMASMANYTLDLEDEGLTDAEKEIDAILAEDGLNVLTKEDVMPVIGNTKLTEIELPELEKLNFETPKDDASSLLNIVKNDKDKEIEDMMSVIKKTLPKKIDEITSWIDIEYKNKVVTYIYKADVDTTKYSKEDLELLANSIQNEACVNAYTTMCPKIKPMFIDAGINMQIRYVDKTDKELSSCEFNETTCKQN